MRKPKSSNAEFRKKMGFDINNEPSELAPIANAIRGFAADARGGFQHKAGWTSQVGQQGGKPAVAVYRGGNLHKARYLADSCDKLPKSVMDNLPSVLKWQGTRSNFRILGQTRNGIFESLVVAMLDDDVAITNLVDSSSVAIHHGLASPALVKRNVNSKGSSRTVLVSTYPEIIRVAWFNTKTGQVIRKIKLSRI